MKIVITGITVTDDSYRKEIEDVEIISIEPQSAYEYIEKEGKKILYKELDGFEVRYKKKDGELTEWVSRTSQFFFKEDKLVVQFSDY